MRLHSLETLACEPSVDAGTLTDASWPGNRLGRDTPRVCSVGCVRRMLPKAFSDLSGLLGTASGVHFLDRRLTRSGRNPSRLG